MLCSQNINDRLHVADRVRIAIALVALQYKPSDQSYIAYTFDLRTKFCSSITIQSQKSTDDMWRIHALHLERNYAALQTKYENEKIKSLSKTESSSPPKSGEASSVASSCVNHLDTPTGSSGSKGKKKKRKRAELIQSTLKATLESLQDESNNLILTSKGPGTLFFALDSFSQLTSKHERVHVPMALLIPVTSRAIKAIGAALQNTVADNTRNVSYACPLGKLNVLLSHVITEAFPLLIQRESGSEEQCFRNIKISLDILISNIVEHIFTPIIHCILPISRVEFRAALSSTTTHDNGSLNSFASSSGYRGNDTKTFLDVDIRAEAFSLFQTILHAVFTSLRANFSLQHSDSCPGASSISCIAHCHSMSNVISSMRSTLILQVVQELAKVTNGIPSTEKESRLERLAAKDALWYYCTFLHILFNFKDIPTTAQTPKALMRHDSWPSASNSSTAVEKAIREAFFNLAIKARKSTICRTANTPFPIPPGKTALKDMMKERSRQKIASGSGVGPSFSDLSTDGQIDPPALPGNLNDVTIEEENDSHDLSDLTLKHVSGMKLGKECNDQIVIGMLLGVVERYMMEFALD